MNTFSQEVRDLILNAYNYYCCVDGCVNRAEEIHHALHNTKLNQKKYPLFIQSIFNARPICKSCHERYSQFKGQLEVTEKQADAYEKYLKSLLQNK